MSDEVKDMREKSTTASQTSSYRSIFKATSLFGGLQVYQILIGIIKSKFIAILLGPEGMGVQGLYQTTLDLIKSFTAFGLEQSAVRDVSEAYGSSDNKRIERTTATINKLVWVTGFLGLLVTLLMSPILSKWTFGNSNFTLGFIILSLTLLLNQICSGQKVLLQGMRRLKDLAKASAIGATIGLLASVPLYYWLGIKGIVPTMVLSSITALLLSWFYANKLTIKKIDISTNEVVKNGTSMLKMGVAMSISSILVTLSAYVLRWFIRSEGGINEVGFFSAGILITNIYVGMVFTAMGTDFYPRLAAVNKDNNRCREVINQQGEVALLIIAPVIISCILFMPLIIRIIYSEAFLPANNYIMFAVSGMVFRAGSYVVSYIYLAKAESKIFIINETTFNVVMLALNIIGYKIGGLSGLGITYSLGYFAYLFQVYIVAHYRYDFRFSYVFIKIFLIQIAFVLFSLLSVLLIKDSMVYLIAGFSFVTCTIFSIRELESRIHFKQFLQNRK